MATKHARVYQPEHSNAPITVCPLTERTIAFWSDVFTTPGEVGRSKRRPSLDYYDNMSPYRRIGYEVLAVHVPKIW